MDHKTIRPWDVGSGQKNADPALPTTRASQPRIEVLARFLSGCCLVMMVGVVVYAVLAMALAWTIPGYVRGAAVPVALLSFAAWICALVALLWGLWNGRVCFAGFAHGVLFSRRTIGGLRNFALGLLVYKAIPALALSALVVASRFAALDLPPKSGITVQDMAEGMFTLASLGTIVVIATVLTHAAQIADDNASIV